VPVFPKMRRHKFDLCSVPLDHDVIAGYDCVLLATDHDRFDYDLIKASARLIVDTRGRYLETSTQIYKA
jgi:UDP-N-acetyl-D-glucosamine dehydrogenase